jgi:predicted nucleic acid-binding protein
MIPRQIQCVKYINAITLATKEPQSVLLLDDYRARKAATALGLEVIGSAGILVRAKRAKLIEAVLPLLLEMRRGGYYMSDGVIERACQEAGEAFSA